MKKTDKTISINALSENFSRAKSLSFVDYQGMAMRDIEKLRGEIGKHGGKFSVAKNTLLKIALRKVFGKEKIKEIEPQLEGQTALLAAYEDELAPLQELVKLQKEKDTPKLKFGIFDNLVVDTESLKTLSLLPSKTTLFGQLLGTLSNPAFNLVHTLQSNLQSLVYILDQRSKQTTQ